MTSICFICKESVLELQSGLETVGPDELKVLLNKSWRVLLQEKDKFDEDWKLLETGSESVTCSNCLQLVLKAQKTLEFLIETQEKLKECLQAIKKAAAKFVKKEPDSCTGGVQQKWSHAEGLEALDDFVSHENLHLGDEFQTCPSPVHVGCVDKPEFLTNETLKSGKRKRKIIVLAEEDETSTEGGCPPKKLKNASPESEICCESLDDAQGGLQVELKPEGNSIATYPVDVSNLKSNQFPFLIINDNLFLYKQNVFVEYNFTHLICKGPSCRFQVYFDYQPSFQVMRNHIENIHGSFNYRRNNRLNCLLCGADKIKHREFRKHMNTAHPEFNTQIAKAICECCLKPWPYHRTMSHQYCHMNREEFLNAKKHGKVPNKGFRRMTREVIEGQQEPNLELSNPTPCGSENINCAHDGEENRGNEDILKDNDSPQRTAQTLSPAVDTYDDDDDAAKNPSKRKLPTPGANPDARVVRKWICDFENCAKLFVTKSYLKIHLNTVHPGSEIAVRSVNQDTRTGTITDNDNDKVTKETTHPFLIINDNLFLFRLNIFVEYNFTHLICKAPGCTYQVPFDYFPSFQLIRSHIQSAHAGHMFRRKLRINCEVCGASNFTHKEFRLHFNTHHPQFSSKLAKGICECCLRPVSLHFAVSHQFYHMNSEEFSLARKLGKGPYKAFRLKDSEITERPFKCTFPECNKSFKRATHLKIHKETHIPAKDRASIVTCSDCGALVQKYTLEKHMKRFHRRDLVNDVIHCPICDKRYMAQDRALLRTHLKAAHGEKSFMCEDCGKTFSTKALLRGHMKCVHVVGDYCCEQCGNKYTKFSSFKKHWQDHHNHLIMPGRQLPKQPGRDNWFYNETEANKQAKELIPERKWPCDLCDVICSQKHVLVRHMSRKHGVSTESGEKAPRFRNPSRKRKSIKSS